MVLNSNSFTNAKVLLNNVTGGYSALVLKSCSVSGSGNFSSFNCDNKTTLSNITVAPKYSDFDLDIDNAINITSNDSFTVTYNTK